MNLVQFTNLKMNLSVHFSVHLKNISKDSMPKSQFRGVFIRQCFKNFEFFGKKLKIFLFIKNAMVPAFFDQKNAKKPWFF